MSFNVNTATMSPADIRAANEGFLNLVKEGPEGVKQASGTINEDVVLTVLREDGIARRVMPFTPITAADLVVNIENPDIPMAVIPVEPAFGEYLAHAIDFMQATKELWFRTQVAPVFFKPIKTKTIKLHEAQLLANNFPIKTYIESVARNDILAVEDIFLIGAIERCVAKFAATNDITSTGTLNKDHIADANQAMIDNRLSTEMVLLNESTYQDILRWNQNTVGDSTMKDLIDNGPKGEQLRYKSWMGLRWVLTNNQDVIAKNELYYLPNLKYVGVAYMLADAEQWIEYRNGVLSTNTREIIGRNLVNGRAPIKQTLS